MTTLVMMMQFNTELKAQVNAQEVLQTFQIVSNKTNLSEVLHHLDELYTALTAMGKTEPLFSFPFKQVRANHAQFKVIYQEALQRYLMPFISNELNSQLLNNAKMPVEKRYRTVP